MYVCVRDKLLKFNITVCLENVDLCYSETSWFSDSLYCANMPHICDLWHTSK